MKRTLSNPPTLRLSPLVTGLLTVLIAVLITSGVAAANDALVVTPGAVAVFSAFSAACGLFALWKVHVAHLEQGAYQALLEEQELYQDKREDRIAAAWDRVRRQEEALYQLNRETQLAIGHMWAQAEELARRSDYAALFILAQRAFQRMADPFPRLDRSHEHAAAKCLIASMALLRKNKMTVSPQHIHDAYEALYRRHSEIRMELKERSNGAN